jgi:hypothetical protein
VPWPRRARLKFSRGWNETPARSLQQFRQAAAEGPAAFDDYLMTTSYEDDQATNMDW